MTDKLVAKLVSSTGNLRPSAVSDPDRNPMTFPLVPTTGDRTVRGCVSATGNIPILDKQFDTSFAVTNDGERWLWLSW